jgi:hypothetical protein
MLIFITGNSRSGTTMMGRILNRHPEVFTFNELHFFGNLWEPGTGKEFLNKQEAIELFAELIARQREGFLIYRHPEKYHDEAARVIENLSETTLKPHLIYRQFLEYETALNGKTIPCEQTPSNNYYTGFLFKEFADSFVINMVRDPRDVLLSQKMKWKRKFLGASGIPLKESLRSYFNYHPVLIALIWKKNVLQSLTYANHERFKQIRFENMVSDAENQIRDLCNFLHLNFTVKMLEIPHAGSSSRSDNPDALGIDKSVSGQWKKGGLTKTEIWWCEKITRQPMELMEYKKSGVKPGFLMLLWLCILLPFKSGISFLMNLKRMKNIRQTLARKFGKL